MTNTNRQVQMGRAALPLPGETRQDWWIIQEIARKHRAELELRHPPNLDRDGRAHAVARQHLLGSALREDLGDVSLPDAPDQPGQDFVSTTASARAGRAKLVAAKIIPPAETPDREYPLVLTTGPQLEHWHTGAMTRRATCARCAGTGADRRDDTGHHRQFGIGPGDMVGLDPARRGRMNSRQDDAIPDGVVFIPFAFFEAAANLLTNPALDPFGKIPEFKYCAARVETADPQREAAE